MVTLLTNLSEKRVIIYLFGNEFVVFFSEEITINYGRVKKLWLMGRYENKDGFVLTSNRTSE